MSTHLYLAPAASGKTHFCIERARIALQESPLADVWVVLPDRHQAVSFRRRLAEYGGALGARIGTFNDVYAEILALANQPLPLTPDAVVHRLMRAAIDTLVEQNCLAHYLSIKHKPGLTQALTTLIGELKRARIYPDDFEQAVRGRGSRLEEIAALYTEYQNKLIKLKWADAEGMGWLAIQELQQPRDLAFKWKLLIVDGFDSFIPNQIELLRLLASHTDEIVLTLSGEMGMRRRAHARFKGTLKIIQDALSPQIETLRYRHSEIPALAYLEKNLFEPSSVRSSQLQNPEPGKNLEFIEAQTLALEAREALRWIKARIKRDNVPLEQCAIIARNLTEYTPFLRQYAREYGVPIRFAGGEFLIGNSAMAAILNLLSLSHFDFARRPFIDTIRAPYCDLSAFGLAREDAFRLDQVARWGQVIRGRDQWREVLARLSQQSESTTKIETDEEQSAPQLPTADAARELGQRLEEFAARITPPAQATLFDYVTWVEDLLSANKGVAVEKQIELQPDTRLRDESAFEKFREVLRALVLSERVVGARASMTWEEFLIELNGAVEAESYHPDAGQPTNQGCVYAADLSVARGVPYRAVALLGLSEGLFPAPISEDPFLSDEERKLLREQHHLQLEVRARNDQYSLFYEAVTCATEYLLLTRPYLAEDGEEWKPSPYWNHVRELFGLKDKDVCQVRAEESPTIYDAASSQEFFVSAIRRKGIPIEFAELQGESAALRYAAGVLHARLERKPSGEFEGDLGLFAEKFAERFGPRQVWSASRLETYGTCAFQFFVRYALELEERETPEAGYDAAQLGSMLHEILEKVYQRADVTNVDAVSEVLPLVAEEVFAKAPTEYGFRTTELWNAQREELIARLSETLRALAEESQGFKPVQFEASFGFGKEPPLKIETDAGVVLAHGRIDRVDANESGELRVIDYKTGTSHLDAKSLIEGRRLQLPFYALGVQEVLRLGRVTDGFYWSILKAQASSLRLHKFHHEDYNGFGGAVELVKKQIAKDVNGIRSGNFVPVALEQGCKYCPAKTFCWRYDAE